ncbi:hypothetical protein B0T09DRAFT_316676 [Sordaria sp. MPI-SDFR-AT-0083]|nr:hypothetical protein B0T09DRAFT_316676 [Sordaria sp. MPI-SDFR-AT-0083]
MASLLFWLAPLGKLSLQPAAGFRDPTQTIRLLACRYPSFGHYRRCPLARVQCPCSTAEGCVESREAITVTLYILRQPRHPRGASEQPAMASGRRSDHGSIVRCASSTRPAYYDVVLRLGRRYLELRKTTTVDHGPSPSPLPCYPGTGPVSLESRTAGRRDRNSDCSKLGTTQV